jgi:hypothetical protein
MPSLRDREHYGCGGGHNQGDAAGQIDPRAANQTQLGLHRKAPEIVFGQHRTPPIRTVALELLRAIFAAAAVACHGVVSFAMLPTL